MGSSMKDTWILRFLILLGFVMFDFLATWTSISYPLEENNALARASMGFFGVYLGLALFGFFIASLLFLILCFCRSLFSGRTKLASLVGSLIIDFCFGWFIAGVHFVGGTSWFWLAPDLIRHCLGAGLYLLVLYLLLAKTTWKNFYRAQCIA